MKCLLLGDQASDFGHVLESCGAEITRMTFEEAETADLSPYQSFCVFGADKVLSPRLRVRLEAESGKAGKRILTEALGSWGDFYCAPPADDTAAIAFALYLASCNAKHDAPTSMIKPQARETAWNTKSIGMNNQGF